MTESGDLNRRLRTELPAALAAGELVAFFQPVVGTSSGKLISAEALVRWEHPKLGMLPPALFIPLLSELGLISELTRLMLDAALRHHRQWAEAGWNIPISVNIGPESVTDPEFPEMVASHLSSLDVPGRMLTLEITERSAIEWGASDNLARLAELGVQLALDDFGAGFSSLERLGDVPVQVIKLDISLIRPLTVNPSFRKIVELTIELAHQLGARVVAEGVETEAVRHELMALGCDFCQGFLFARPMAAAEFLAWLPENGQMVKRQQARGRQWMPGGSPGVQVDTEPGGADESGRVWRRVRAAVLGAVDNVGLPALCAAAILLTVYGLWQAFRWGGRSHQALIGDLAFVPVNGIAIVAAFRASRRRAHGRPTCRAWALLGVALSVYLLGDLLQLVYEVVLHERAYPTWADACYLTFYVVAFMGLLSFPTRRRTSGERFRLVLDMAIVFVGGASIIWYVALGPAVSSASGFDLASIVTFAYPIGDLILLFGVVSLLARGVRRSSATALKMVAAGLLVFVAADVCYDDITLHSTYLGGDPVDTLWIVALVVVFLAASSQLRSQAAPELTALHHPAIFRPNLLPYVAIAGSYLLLLEVGLRRLAFDPLGGLLIAAVLLTALVSVRQLTALRDNGRLTARYRALAAIDGLTGLYNRRHFMDLAETVFAQAHRLDLPLCALMVDIDHFKQINDRFGHATGDQVIAHVARVCQERVRPQDIVGRFGGDELVLLLPDTTSEQAGLVAERLNEQTVVATVDGLPVPFTLSVGVAEATGSRNIDGLLARADIALYEAKAAGRGCYRTFDDGARELVAASSAPEPAP